MQLGTWSSDSPFLQHQHQSEGGGSQPLENGEVCAHTQIDSCQKQLSALYDQLFPSWHAPRVSRLQLNLAAAQFAIWLVAIRQPHVCFF